MKFAVLAAAVAFVSTPAFAALSNHSFAWTGGTEGRAMLVLDGGIALTAQNRGWVAQDGSNNFGGDGGNYIVGACGSSDSCGGDDLERNNYFRFSIDIGSAISSGVLYLDQPENVAGNAELDGFLSYLPNHQYTLYDVLGDVLGGSGVPLFADLGSGVSFGSTVLDVTSNGTIVAISLNAAAIASINAAAGQNWFVGGSLNTAAIPEPATWAMMIAGFGLVGAAARRRRMARSFV